MAHNKPKSMQGLRWVLFSALLLLGCALVLSLPVRPAAASPVAQAATGTLTLTVTLTGTGTLTQTPTVTPTGTTTPGTATPTVTGTITPATATPTVTGTITPATPTRTRTPAVLVPVTGADFTQPEARGGGQVNVGMWVAVWMVGMLLVFYGLRSKQEK